MVLHFFRIPGPQSEQKVLQLIRDRLPTVTSVQTEACFNVDCTGGSLSGEERSKLLWLFTETFEPELTKDTTFLAIKPGHESYSAIVEVGPRMAFSTAWSSNCVSMCQACGINSVTRIERSRRYLISTSGPSVPLKKEDIAAFAALVHDRMTECVYTAPLKSFENGVAPEPIRIIPLLTGM
jgi:phosphoribosylformylglycinamidine synthase